MRSALAFLLVIAAAACATAPTETGDPSHAAGGADGVLRTGAAQYRPGARAELILRNTLQHQIGYNLCTATLERRANGSWLF